MQVQRIPAGIYQANCYLVMDDTTREAVLIDPAGDAPFLLKKIREQEADVKAILLTHGHGDHIGAAQELKDTLSVPILAHKDEVELLKDPNLNLSKSMFHGPYSIRPDQVFSEETLPYLSGIQVIHTPGHTEGSVCFIIEQAMLSGDTLFLGSIGRTDLATSDPTKMQTSLERLKTLDPTLSVYPGHGVQTTMEQELQRNPFLR
ncbi:MAG: MBL fold metallo-hydrolase [Tissierellia bacterium]|jgi:hydroxyacylglutathione hydrolase|nr:MBL fold metallo-hydrolase [Bacillota bacterium]NLK58177.1 MBL fold metallo-hydrolase [Tissierellia bacterium]